MSNDAIRGCSTLPFTAHSAGVKSNPCMSTTAMDDTVPTSLKSSSFLEGEAAVARRVGRSDILYVQ
jgi:hypothetical protein